MTLAGRALIVAAALGLVASMAAVAASAVDALVFVIAIVLFTSPGWPLARWVAGDGRDPLSAIILALPLGYGTGATATLLLRLAGVSHPVAILGTCGGIAVALAVWTRRPQPGVIALVRLERRDWIGLGLLWLLAVLLVGPVFVRVGEPTPTGLAYRAYFIADLFAHMSVVGELVKGVTPPVNPYLVTEGLPYYWSYFTLPAVVTAFRPGPQLHHVILLTDLFAAAWFIGVAYLVLRSLGTSVLAATTSWAVAVAASSFEGLFFVLREAARGGQGESFRLVNIDAITRWIWDLPPVDGLHRLMWYTPQHETAVTFGLLVLASVVLARERDGLRRGILEGVLLGAAFAFSSLNGILLVLSYAVGEVAMLAWNRFRAPWRWIAGRSAAALIVMVFVGVTAVLEMIQQTPDAFIFGWNRHFLKGPWAFLLLSFGPALFLAPTGVARAVRRQSRLMAALVALMAVNATAFLVFDVRGHENAYVVFRTAQWALVVLAVLLAFGIDAWRDWPRQLRRATVGLLVVGAAAAVPTTALDWYNARDVTNVAMNPGGFPWTVHLSPDEQVATRWVQRNVPPSATVQTDAQVRGRWTWALVPAFGRRRLATGVGLFEPNPRRFDANLTRIHGLFGPASAEAAYSECQRLRIDYLWVGDVERRAHGESLRKFSDRPDLFRPVFRLNSVEIFQVVH